MIQKQEGGKPYVTRPKNQLNEQTNDHVLPADGVKSVLDVALSDDTDVSNNLDSSSPEHMVFIISQRLGRRDDDRIPGVRSERIKVLHVAANDSVLNGQKKDVRHPGQTTRPLQWPTYISSISNNFVLDLLPAFQRLLNQHLRTQSQRLGRQVSKLILVVGESRSKTSEREGRSEDDGVTDHSRSLESSVDGRHGGRLSSRNVDFFVKTRRVLSNEADE